MENCEDVESDFQFSPIFDEMCPIYMSYGMTYDDYWYGDATLCKYYREAYKVKQNKLDEQLWLQGYYVYIALSAVSPVMQAFAKKGTKPLPYLKSPITQTEEYKEQQSDLSEEEKQTQIENERLIARLHFDALARTLNKRFEDKKQGE